MTSNYYTSVGNCLSFGSQGKLFEKSLFSVEEVLRRIRKRLKYGINYIFNTKSFSWKEKNCKQKKNIKFSCSLLLLFNGGNWGGADGG